MTSTYTPNKDYELPATGDLNGTWGVHNNANFSRVDLNLGGVLAVAMAAANVTLTTTDIQYLVIEATGVLGANRTIFFPASGSGLTNGGFWIVNNRTTGNFSVGVAIVAGTPFLVPQGGSMLVWSDGTTLRMLDSVGGLFASQTTTAGTLDWGDVAALTGQVTYQGRGLSTDIGCIYSGKGTGGTTQLAHPTNGVRFFCGTGILGADSATSKRIFNSNTTTVTTGANAAACAMQVNMDTGTSRSINASGTLNASGADYAEYEHKAPGCVEINKGDIVGFNADGLLVTSFSQTVSRFAIKSTSPNFVGGDAWAAPAGPVPEAPEVVDTARSVKESNDGLEGNELASRIDSEHAVRMSAYLEVKLSHEEAVEALRQGVDRIAYCGKTPCNVAATSLDVGKYVVPVAGANDTISAELVAVQDMTLKKLLSSVGVIHSIGDDGRPIVAVGVR